MQGADFFQQFSVFLVAGRVRFCPSLKFCLLLSLLLRHIIAIHHGRLALIVLVRVHQAGVRRSEGNAYGIAFVHGRFHQLGFDAHEGNAVFIAAIEGHLYCRGRQVAVGAAWVTHDHGIIPFFYALEGNRQVVLGFEGLVFSRIIGWFAVRPGIDAQQGKVARMPGPHPVVGIKSELTHRAGRSTHEAHVAVDFIDKQVILQALVHLLDHGIVLGALRRLGGNLLKGILLLHGVFPPEFHHFGGDIF